MNILVTGSNGQLGSEIQELSDNYSDYNFVFTDVEALDITNLKQIQNCMLNNEINAIINCAAYTAVDKAETELELATKINSDAVSKLAVSAKKFNAVLVHVSTDYVFDGSNNTPYKENEPTKPLGVYGRTKREGEEAVRKVQPTAAIIRTSWLYSSYGNNFVKTMLRLGKERDELGVIFDQVGTPTYARDLAKTILDILPIIKKDKVETYHFSNEGVASWYDFTKAIFELSNISTKLNPIETKDFPTPTARPAYSVLNKSKIKEHFKIEIPYWRDSLMVCLDFLL